MSVERDSTLAEVQLGLSHALGQAGLLGRASGFFASAERTPGKVSYVRTAGRTALSAARQGGTTALVGGSTPLLGHRPASHQMCV